MTTHRKPLKPLVNLLRLTCMALLVLPVILNADSFYKPEFEIRNFKESDNRYLQQGYERINELAQRHFGGNLQRSLNHDLDILQRLLDQKFVTAKDRRLLQDMGLVLGELLRQNDELKWVVYEDKYGPSRALQLKHTNNYLFPITMISRRAETGLAVDVSALYKKATDKIAEYRATARRNYY